MSDPDKREVLRKCAAILAEHFNAVQIVAEEYTPENESLILMLGSGSWYARVAMAQTFADRHRAGGVGEFVKRHQDD